MMNKMKSAGLHLVKFLFVLPLLAVLLVAFRNSYQEQQISSKPPSLKPSIRKTFVFTDTVPSVTELNNKGYLIDIKGVNGNCTVVVKDKDGKEVTRVLLNEWKENMEKFEEKYGEILPAPPTPPTPPGIPIAALAPVAPVEQISRSLTYAMPQKHSRGNQRFGTGGRNSLNSQRWVDLSDGPRR